MVAAWLVLAMAAGALHAAAGDLEWRARVDPDAVPWRAVGKLQAVSENFRQTRTGTLVGPALVLSAAQCLFKPTPGASLRWLGAFSDRLRRTSGRDGLRDRSGVQSGPVE